MKVLLVAASDSGGAGVACLRLLRALRMARVDARMLVLHRSSDDEGVVEWIQPYRGIKRKIQKVRQIVARFLSVRKADLYVRGRLNKWDSFTPPFPAILNADHPLIKWADVIHLHWCAQFWNWGAFRHIDGKRILWTFHDLNPVTGGCHFPAECRQFESQCLICPQLKGTRNDRVVEKAFSYKKHIMQRTQLRITVIAPSKWISVLARRSALLGGHIDHIVIPYTFGESIFHPLDQDFCKDIYSLPHDKRVVLFAASYFGNHRKGMDVLIDAIELLSTESNLVFCAAGRSSGESRNQILYLGNITDERMMAAAYNAADICVVPSREDNLPNTVGESISCGTPVVAFNRGGIPEMIEDGVNGVLVEEVAAKSLAEGIRKCLQTSWREDLIAAHARKKYASRVVAELHEQVYNA